MSQDIELSTLYVELDCLLDTRLSLIAEYGEKAVEIALQKGYLTRLTDSFEGIDPEDYKRVYEQRNKSLLKNAIVTPIINMVRSFVIETIKTSTNSPFNLRPNVVVNAYPYVLNSEEEEVLLSIIGIALDGACDIRLIYKPMEDILPSMVKTAYSVMIMYRYDLWAEYHAQKKHFEKVICPDVTVIGPQLYFNGLPKIEDLSKIDNNKNPFQYLEECFKPIINLITYPASFFSVNINDGNTEGFTFKTSS